VDFAGWRDDVPAILHAADAYVHSSLWEGPPLPLAMLEAMASRLPFIGTDCSGYPAGFQNGRHGFIVPTGRAGELARAMEAVAAMDHASLAEASEDSIEWRFLEPHV
jgi:glycosyltransferase involved in cell wall biosynthesis